MITALGVMPASAAYGWQVPSETKRATEAARPPIGRVHAICVGVADYQAWRMAPLPGASVDAGRVHAVLQRVYGYHSTLLLDEDATQDAILGAIDSLDDVTENDAVIFYFAGHCQTEEIRVDDTLKQYGYLIPYRGAAAEITADDITPDEGMIEPRGDAAPDGDAFAYAGVDRDGGDESRVRVDIVRDRLMALDAKHVVMIIDACFAGVAVNLELPGAIRSRSASVSDTARFRWLSKGSRVVLTAGTADEEAFESDGLTDDGLPAGVFTHFLLDALEASGQAVSTQELYLTVFSKVDEWATRAGRQRTEGQSMTPQRRDLGSAAGDFVFVRQPLSAWLEAVAELIQALADRPAHGAETARDPDGGESTAGSRSRPMTQAERDRAERERRARLLEENQPYLDMMVAVNEAARLSRGEPHDADSPRWSAMFERNRALAAQGNPTASAVLAYAYKYGLGTPRNESRARVWAAESRDIGGLEGEIALQLVADLPRIRNMDDAVEIAKERAVREGGQAAAITYAIATLGGADTQDARTLSAAAGVMAALVEIFADRSPLEYAVTLDDARREWLQGLDDRTVGREELGTIYVRLTNAAGEIRKDAMEHEDPDSLYSMLVPQLALRVNTLAKQISERRLSNGMTREEAIATLDRLTDEMLVLTTAEYAVEHTGE